jgi:hypothetical protein
MTEQDIDDAKAKAIKANEGNFCSTFLMIDLRNLEEQRKLLREANALSHEKLVEEYVYLKFNNGKLEMQLESHKDYEDRLKGEIRRLDPTSIFL